MALAQAVYRYGGKGGEVKKYNAAAAMNGGDVEVINDRIGVVARVSAVAIGDDYTLQTDGVHEMEALGSDTFTDGALVYWDNTNNRLTTTSAGNTAAGKAVGAKGSGPTRALCDVNASPAS